MHIDSINSQVQDSVCFPLIEKGAVIFRFILMLVWINSTLEDLVLDLDMGYVFSACLMGIIREYLIH